MPDIAKRFPENPILRPADIDPSTPGMKIECLLNPGVFRYRDRTWLLLRVAERSEQKPGKISFPVMNGGITPQIYYGASDGVICGARFSIQEILRTLD